MSNKKIKDMSTFWYKKGDKGYMCFDIKVYFDDGSIYEENFATILSPSDYLDDTPLVYLEDLITCGYLTTSSCYVRFGKMLNESWWKDAVNFHDNVLIEEKENHLNNLKMRLHKFNEVNK